MKSQIATTITALALAGTSAAFPTIPNIFQPLRVRNGSNADLLAQQIAQVAPTSTSCAETEECRTNVQLAPFFLDALERYKVTQPGAIAAVVALTALESGEYKFKHNLFPGNRGQGTSNMQSFGYNVKYGLSIPELAGQVAALSISVDNPNSATNATKDALLALVTPDEYNFGSGPWFLSSQCPDTLAAFASGADLDATWIQYNTGCVGVGDQVDADRMAYWYKAKAAFGLA